MSEELELLPCPFCGGEAVIFEGDADWGVDCLVCRVMVRGETTEGNAIAAWNRRPKPKTCFERWKEELKPSDIAETIISRKNLWPLFNTRCGAMNFNDFCREDKNIKGNCHKCFMLLANAEVGDEE